MTVPASHRHHRWLAVALLLSMPAAAQLSQPGVAPARGPDAPDPRATPTPTPAPGETQGTDGSGTGGQGAEGQGADGQGVGPIVPDAEFNAALPPLSGDINAPLEAMTPLAPAQATTPAPGPQPLQAPGSAAPVQLGDTLGEVTPDDPQIAQPLEPLATFDSTPLQSAVAANPDLPELRYTVAVNGLEPLGLDSQFEALSALEEGDGKAANTTQVSARAREDEALAVRLMRSLGYYDATATSVVEPGANAEGRYRVVLTATPGRLYTLSSVNVQAAAVVPEDLIRTNLPLRVGDPIEAARIQGAEANVSLVLPQRGYPFVEVGQRDILLEDQSPQAVGAYTLPVNPGPRSSFGRLTTEGEQVFGLDHLNVFPRFEQGDLFDRRLQDDLRDALVATGLFNSLAVEPRRTGRIRPDGTEEVDLLVRQTKGPARTLAAAAGFSTGQGIRLEGTWQHRNLFPDEGALIATGVAGTQEQGAGVTFRRSNAGRRDRTFQLIANASHQNYDAYEAFIGTLSVRWSYDSTPIWQKPLTYAYGAELIGTNEDVFDFALNDRNRRTFGIAALPGQVVFDRSDNLLNPTRGYRLKLNVSPEAAVGSGFTPYVRTMVEGTAYFPVSSSLVIAGRVRAGSIQGIGRDDLAPSRRYYGGGGGSVRGYGYQRLGPFEPVASLVPNEDGEIDLGDLRPLGGRSLNEFALEARYRFGDFGIVPFIDAGNSYEGTFPTFSALKFGAGIGGRFYTNFGPFRVDVATPLNPRPGDGKVALYISIGQAF